ncbi:hypothetical protein C8Q75DRAFT_809345 [Abortiporus biennis]|nr:hypothetical protein C8Q75DRAFT_809345 [Abortiporus biennis]
MYLSSLACFKAPRRLETNTKPSPIQKTAKGITKVVRSISTSTQLASSKYKSLLLRKKKATEESVRLLSTPSPVEVEITVYENAEETVQIIDTLELAIQTPLPESQSVSSSASDIPTEDPKAEESEVVSLVASLPTAQSEVNISETFLLPLITPLPEGDDPSLNEISNFAIQPTVDFEKDASAPLTTEQDTEKVIDPCNVLFPLSPSSSMEQLSVPAAQYGDNEESFGPEAAFGLESAISSGSMIMCVEDQVVKTSEIPATLDEREASEEPIHESLVESSSDDDERIEVQQLNSTDVKLNISELPSYISPFSSRFLIDMSFSHESNELSTSFSEGSTVISLDTLFSRTVPSKEEPKGLVAQEFHAIIPLSDVYAALPEDSKAAYEEPESMSLSEVDSDSNSSLALALLTPLPPSFSSVISLPNLFEAAPLGESFLHSFASLHLDNLFDNEAFSPASEVHNSNDLGVATTFLTGLPTPPSSPLLGDGEVQGATAEVLLFSPRCTDTVPSANDVQTNDYVLPTPPPSPELRSALVVNLANPAPSPPSPPIPKSDSTTPAQSIDEEKPVEEEDKVIDEEIIKLREHVSDVLRNWGENAIESRNLGLRKIQLRNWLESSVDAVEACLTLIGEQKFDWSKKVEIAPKKVGDLVTKQCNRHKNIIKACTTDNFGSQTQGPIHPFTALSGLPSPNAPPPPPPFNGQGQFIPISKGGPETKPNVGGGGQRSAKSMYMVGLASSGKNGVNTGAQVCGDVASAIREAMKNGKPKLRSTLGGRSLWERSASEEVHEAAQVKLRSRRDPPLSGSETSSSPAQPEELEVLDPEALRKKAHRFLWALRKVKLPDSDPKKTLPMDEWTFTEEEYKKAEMVLKERKMQKEREQSEALDAEIRAKKLKSTQINSGLGFDGWSRNLKSVSNNSMESTSHGSESDHIDFRGSLKSRVDHGSPDLVPESEEEQDGPLIDFRSALRTVSETSNSSSSSHSHSDLLNHPAFRRKMMRSGKQDDVKEILNIYRMKQQIQERVTVASASRDKPEFLQARNMLKKAPENLRMVRE